MSSFKLNIQTTRSSDLNDLCRLISFLWVGWTCVQRNDYNFVIFAAKTAVGKFSPFGSIKRGYFFVSMIQLFGKKYSVCEELLQSTSARWKGCSCPHGYSLLRHCLNSTPPHMWRSRHFCSRDNTPSDILMLLHQFFDSNCLPFSLINGLQFKNKRLLQHLTLNPWPLGLEATVLTSKARTVVSSSA